MSKVCGEPTKRGTKCRNKTKHNSGKCYHHLFNTIPIPSTIKPTQNTSTQNTSTIKPTQNTLTIKPTQNTLTIKPTQNTLTIKPTQHTSTQNEIDCIICTDAIDDDDKVDDKIMTCTHTKFHKSCLQKCFKAECPLCRKPHNLKITGKAPEPDNEIPPEFQNNEAENAYNMYNLLAQLLFINNIDDSHNFDDSHNVDHADSNNYDYYSHNFNNYEHEHEHEHEHEENQSNHSVFNEPYSTRYATIILMNNVEFN